MTRDEVADHLAELLWKQIRSLNSPYDWADWKLLMENLLGLRKLDKLMTTEKEPPPPEDEEQLEEWKRKQVIATKMVWLGCGSVARGMIEKETTLAGAFQILEKRYEPSEDQLAFMRLVRESGCLSVDNCEEIAHFAEQLLQVYIRLTELSPTRVIARPSDLYRCISDLHPHIQHLESMLPAPQLPDTSRGQKRGGSRRRRRYRARRTARRA